MFTDRLITTLSLSIGSETHALSAGQIERFAVELQAWGFQAEVCFYISSEQQPDPLFDVFIGSALINATLTYARKPEGSTQPPVPVKVSGYVLSRAVSEVVGEALKGAPVVGRRYEIRFADPAQAFWTQHRPVELLVQACMQDLLDAHKPTGVEINYDWSATSTKQAVLAVALDAEAEPSFYDFLLHWVDRNQGVFELDTTRGEYRLGAKKSAVGDATALCAQDVAHIRLLFPEPPRFVARVLQSFAEAPLTRELLNPLAAGVRRDVIMRTPIAAEVSARIQLEGSRLRSTLPGIEVAYQRCPETLTAPLGLLRVDDGFSQRIYPAATTYRVTGLRISARHSLGVAVEPEDSSALYEMELVHEAEDRLNAVAKLPAFRDPRRTLRVEGKIVSAGAAGQRTWAAIENEDDSLWMYKVFIPLFNKEVPAPFAPGFATGHFFFPAYKDQRVLVELDFDRAAITGFLDWSDEGRLPSDSQGNQIVLGPKSTNGTVIRHSYIDAIPVLNVERKASVETSTLQLGDGTLKISLVQSSAVPTTVPLYDVSPRVEVAKDAVVGEIGGSVTSVTTQFETAAANVSAAIEDTSANVQREITAAERELGGKLDQAETELQGLLADATAAAASLSMGGRRAKARLDGALDGVDGLRAPLLALQARLVRFRQSAELRARELSAEIEQLPDTLHAPLDDIERRAASLRDRAHARIASLKAEVETLGPRSGSGAWAELTRFRQEVQGVDADRAQCSAQLDAKLEASVQRATAQWSGIDGSLTRARSKLSQSVAAAQQAVETQLTQTSARLSARLRTSVGAERARLTSIEPRLQAMQATLHSNLTRERSQLDGALAATTQRVAQGREQLQRAGQAAVDEVKQGVSSVSDALHAILEAVDRAHAELLRASQTAHDQLMGGIESIEQAVVPKLDAVPDTVAQARQTLLQAAQAAVDACRELLRSITRLLSQVESAASLPLTTALSAIDSAESSARSTLQTAGQTLDSTTTTAQTTLQGFVSTFQSLVDGAGGALGSVRGLVHGAREQIMPPIDALNGLIDQLQSNFQTGVNLLTAFLDKAHAALDAIPAASLPKSAVQPAITAIGAALDAVLPVIQKSAKTAGDQLASMGVKLANQVQAAEDAGMQAVTTFVATLTQQIEAILPPLRKQLAAVQTQIDNTIEQVLTQLDQLTTVAIDAIRQTLEAVSTQVSSAANTVSGQLDQAEAQLTQLVDNVRSQLAEKREQLKAQAMQRVAEIGASVEQAANQLDERAEALEASIAQARAALEARVAAALATLTPRIAALRSQLAQLPEQLEQRLAPLAERNSAVVAEVTRLVPPDADIDAAVVKVREPLLVSLAQLGQEIDRA